MSSLLSPLTLARIREQDDKKPPARERAFRVSAWECPTCGELYSDRLGAEECCSNDDLDEWADTCPVCGTQQSNPDEGVDCCLWKDLDVDTRRKVAGFVWEGESWQEAIAKASGGEA